MHGPGTSLLPDPFRPSEIRSVVLPILNTGAPAVRIYTAAGKRRTRALVYHVTAGAGVVALLSYSTNDLNQLAAAPAQMPAAVISLPTTLAIYLTLSPGQVLYGLASVAQINLMVHVWEDGLPVPAAGEE